MSQKLKNTSIIMAGAVFFTSLFGATAQAQKTAPAKAPAPVQATPQRTASTFGDWVLRCEKNTESQPVQKICEVAQSLQIQGQQGPVAQIAFGRLAKTDPMKLTIVVPSNVSFPSSIRVALDDADTAPVELAWRRCVPGACIADANVSDAALQRFRARTEGGKFTFKDAAGRDLSLALSWRGLAQGLDALAKE